MYKAEKLLDECSRSSRVPLEQISGVWDVSLKSLELYLLRGKAVEWPRLGVWCPGSSAKNTQHTFIPSEQFIRSSGGTYSIKATRPVGPSLVDPTGKTDTILCALTESLAQAVANCVTTVNIDMRVGSFISFNKVIRFRFVSGLPLDEGGRVSRERDARMKLEADKAERAMAEAARKLAGVPEDTQSEPMTSKGKSPSFGHLPVVEQRASSRPSTASGSKPLMPGPLVPYLLTPSTAPAGGMRNRRLSLPSSLVRSAMGSLDTGDDDVDEEDEDYDAREVIKQRAQARQMSAQRRMMEEKAELERLRAQLRQEQESQEAQKREARDKMRQLVDFNEKLQKSRVEELEMRPRTQSHPGGILYRRPEDLTELQKLDRLKADIQRQMTDSQIQRRFERAHALQAGLEELRRWKEEMEKSKFKEEEEKLKKIAAQRVELDKQVQEQKAVVPALQIAQKTEMPGLMHETREYQDAKKKEAAQVLLEQKQQAQERADSRKQMRQAEMKEEIQMVKAYQNQEERKVWDEQVRVLSRRQQQRQYFEEEIKKRSEEKAILEELEREPTPTGLLVGEKRKKKRRYVHQPTDLTLIITSSSRGDT